jgi:hypothetical protein
LKTVNLIAVSRATYTVSSVDDTVLDVLEDAVSESVATGVGPLAAPGQRRR